MNSIIPTATHIELQNIMRAALFTPGYNADADGAVPNDAFWR